MKTSISFETAIRLVHIEVIDFQTTATTSPYMMHREAVTFKYVETRNPLYAEISWVKIIL